MATPRGRGVGWQRVFTVAGLCLLALLAGVVVGAGGPDQSLDSLVADLESGRLTRGGRLGGHQRYGKAWAEDSAVGDDGTWWYTIVFRDDDRIVVVYSKGEVYGAVLHRRLSHPEPGTKWYFLDQDLFKQHINAAQQQTGRRAHQPEPANNDAKK